MEGISCRAAYQCSIGKVIDTVYNVSLVYWILYESNASLPVAIYEVLQ